MFVQPCQGLKRSRAEIEESGGVGGEISPDLLRRKHRFGTDAARKLGGGDGAGLQRFRFERRAVRVRGFGDFGGFVVSNQRRERGHEHQRILEMPGDGGGVRLQSGDAVRRKRLHDIA